MPRPKMPAEMSSKTFAELQKIFRAVGMRAELSLVPIKARRKRRGKAKKTK